MENSVESTLEKIKLQNNDNEAKLKEKRTHEAKVVSLNRAIRDSINHAARLKNNYLDAVTKIETLSSRLEIEKLRRTALTSLLEKTQNELLTYQETSVQGVSAVWNLRSLLCRSVQEVSDQCDVWALITKPQSIQLAAPRKAATEVMQSDFNDERLQRAIKKHAFTIAERDRLQSEPDAGEEFLRIKNALYYSETMAANLK